MEGAGAVPPPTPASSRGSSARSDRSETWVEIAGVPMTPDFAAVGLVYFAQGALGLAALAKPFLLKDSLQLPPAEASVLLSLTYWPWALKPLYGFVADTFPIFGSRRRAYLLVSGLASAVGWLGLAGDLHGASKEWVLMLMMLGNLGIAISDVVVDGLVVEKARDDPQLMGGLQSYSWGCRGVGAVLSAYLSGYLLEVLGASRVFALTAALPLFIAAAAALIEEVEVAGAGKVEVSLRDAMQQVGTQTSELWQVLRSPEVLPPVLFIAAWQMTPNSGSAMFYYLTNGLHMGPEFLGRTQLAGALASLGGIFLYNRVFAAIPLRSYLLWVNLAAALVGLLPLMLVTRTNVALGIPDQAFVIGDDVVQTVAGELAHMPVLVLAAQLCPPGIEATFFALLMSVLNVSGLIASLLGSWLTSQFQITESDFTNLGWLVAVCNLSGLLPLVLLQFVREPQVAGASKPTAM